MTKWRWRGVETRTIFVLSEIKAIKCLAIFDEFSIHRCGVLWKRQRETEQVASIIFHFVITKGSYKIGSYEFVRIQKLRSYFLFNSRSVKVSMVVSLWFLKYLQLIPTSHLVSCSPLSFVFCLTIHTNVCYYNVIKQIVTRLRIFVIRLAFSTNQIQSWSNMQAQISAELRQAIANQFAVFRRIIIYK